MIYNKNSFPTDRPAFSRGGWLVLFLSLLLFGASCTTVPTNKTVSVAAPNFFGLGEDLAQQLITNRRRSLGKGERLIFTSLVNLDDLSSTSKFGRTLSESLATRLFQYGYGVEEIRKLSTILVKDSFGEIILSRDVAKLAKQHNCDLVVAGTYALTPRTVIINVKFLDALSNEVISVAGMELQRSTSINYLLSNNDGIVDPILSSYER